MREIVRSARPDPIARAHFGFALALALAAAVVVTSAILLAPVDPDGGFHTPHLQTLDGPFSAGWLAGRLGGGGGGRPDYLGYIEAKLCK